ncbi:MAG TPA: MFS transporter [Candidatus Saccharimonadales bacterium]|nr:MFS transporter [Candidatus Saccharimonadales bacterium]
MKDKIARHWFILVLLALAQFMVVLDVSIVNVMLPTVQKAFHLSNPTLQWIITAYTLAFGGFLLLGGRAADLFGRRRIFLLGVAIFSLASLADGLSQNGGQLIVLRAVQGLAGALMSPAALSIVLVTYKEGAERNKALAVWGAVASGGAAVGVLLGGIITQYLTWRWNFFINVPIGIFVFIAARAFVDRHASEETHRDLDLPGAIFVTSGLMMLVYALTKTPTYGWLDHRTLGFFGVSVALLIAFVVNELIAKHPLVDFKIFKIRNVSGANVAQMSIAAGLFSIFFVSTLYLQEILGYTPVRTGFAFLPVPFIIAIAATNAPRLIKKVGYRPLLIAGPAFVALGLYMLGHITVGSGYTKHILPGLLVMGFGLGFTFVSMLIAATSGVPRHLAGLASGLNNTAQQVGGSLGLAVVTGIATASATRYLSHLHTRPTAHMITVATVHGYSEGYYTGAAFAVFAILLGIFVIRQQKGETVPEGIPVS